METRPPERVPRSKHSPDHPKAFVLLEFAVGCEDGDIFRERRRNQHSIERVAMMSGQSKQAERMLRRQRQDGQVQVEDELLDVFACEWGQAPVGLDGDFVKRNRADQAYRLR